MRGDTRRLRERIDLALLLTARGASAAEVGAEFGVTGRTVARVLTAVAREDYAAAIGARAVLKSDHGTRKRYDRGCRCPSCTEANTERARLRRQSRSPSSHGTVSAYRNYGCRCTQCREGAHKAENATNYAKVQSGQYQMRHGTVPRFYQGCRCPDCKFAFSELLARRTQANAESLDTARHHRQQWTGAELEIALVRDANGNWLRTAPEVASMIGRSLWAVQARRSREKDPRVGRIAGVT